MIIFKKQVAADTKYSVANQPNLTIFDAHNDTPYNMGISFGRDTGVDNADYYTTAHTTLTGIGPQTNAPTVGAVKWTGTIYIYTETPLGTGSTDLTSAPAFQITVIGYPAGYQPSGTTSLSRMTSTPNTVSTNTMTSTTASISNTGNPAATPIVTSQVSGDGSNAILWTNDAKLQNGDAANPGYVQFDNDKASTDGSGNWTSTSYNGLLLGLNSGSGGVRIGKSALGDCIDQTSTNFLIKAVNGGLTFQSPSGT